MSRYRRDRDFEYDYSGAPPQSQRWDASRFSRESQYRNAPVIEERPPYEAPRRAETTYYDDERDYYERDVRDSRGDFRERRYYEEDDYYDPRAGAGAMVPFRPERPARPSAPPRPRMVRRQSSVDRIDFERRQSRRYYDDYRLPPPPPAQVEIRRSRDTDRYYDDVRVSDPDYYGDDGFREYREREWVRSRSRNADPSPDRRAPTAASVRSSRHSEIVEVPPPAEEHIEEHFSEHIEEEKVEKPYPRRGKTRMPRRLVHTKVLFDLGYSFYEEDEKTIIITKALGPDNIDEVFSKSKELFEAQTTTKLIEAPPMSPSSRTISVAPPPPPPLSVHESVHLQKISEAPASVREWDNLIDRSPSPGSSVSQSTRKSTRRSKSQSARRESFHESFHFDDRKSVAPSRVSRGPSRHGSVHQSLHEDIHIDDRKSIAPSRTSRAPSRKESVHESFHEDIHIDEHRDASPARTARTGRSSRRSRSRRRSSSRESGTTIIERRKTVIEEGPVGLGESNSIDIGPLALLPSRASKRTDADIQAEIEQLERERSSIRRDTETIRYERSRSRDPLKMGTLRSSSPRGEVIVADRTTGEDIRVRKDKRAARSRSRPPGPALLKSMMYTVT